MISAERIASEAPATYTSCDPRSAIERASRHITRELIDAWATARYELRPTAWVWIRVHATTKAIQSACRGIPEIVPSCRIGRESADLLSSVEDELHLLTGIALWNLTLAQHPEIQP